MTKEWHPRHRSRFDVAHTRVHVERSLTGLRDFRTVALVSLSNFELQSRDSSDITRREASKVSKRTYTNSKYILETFKKSYI